MTIQKNNQITEGSMQKLFALLTFSFVFYLGSITNLRSAEKEQPKLSEREESKREPVGDEMDLEPEQASNQKKVPPLTSGVEKSKDAIYQGAVDFAKWVDKFFGEQQELEDAGYDYLRMVNRLIILEGEAIKYRPRIKAKVHLPQFNNKTSLLFSNDRAASIDGSEFEENEKHLLADDENLSAAVNYESDTYAQSKFDFRLGIDSSLDTFAFIKHSMPLYESDKLEIRNFNYLFWEEEQGFGVKVQLELNKVLDEQNLFRWKYSTLRAEKSEGTEWYNLFSLVSQISEEKWIAYELGVNGDTEQSYHVENYRFSVRFRNQTSVDWLYFEVEPEVRYFRSPESPDRELVAGLIFRLEIQFEKNRVH